MVCSSFAGRYSQRVSTRNDNNTIWENKYTQSGHFCTWEIEYTLRLRSLILRMSRLLFIPLVDRANVHLL